MFKKKLKFSVTKNGKPLSKSLYTWDENTRTFSTAESNLVLNFRGIDGVTFITGSLCIFITGSHCKFTTGVYCIFYTGNSCVFNTGNSCKFITGFRCIFYTGANCAIIRRDKFETIKLEKKFNHIELNEFGIPGYIEVLPTDLYIWE